MVTTINPADCKPGEVYEGTVHGVERTVLIRRDASDSYPWESLGEVLDHEDVSGLVRLVPVREVTRRDLPYLESIIDATSGQRAGTFGYDEAILDAVVAHLNANGGLPASSDGVFGVPREDYKYVDWPATCAAEIERADRAEADRDRWRRAHAIVEQERDQARAQRDDLQAKLDSLRVTYKNLDARANKIVERVAAAERERDEAHVLANRRMGEVHATQVERDEALEASALFQRDVHEWRTRAEAAEARTAPAVSRIAIEHAIMAAGVVNAGYVDGVADNICALFGVEAEPADPVEPEGDVIVRDAHDRMWWVTDDGWTNGTSRLDHDWADVPKPIRVTYRAESEAKR